MNTVIRSFVFTVLSSALSFTLLLSGCNPQESEEVDCTPSNNEIVELTSELSGKTFNVGDTVELKWKIDRDAISNGSVDLKITIDNGLSWSTIPEGSIDIPVGEQYQCMAYKWVIGEENEIVDYQQTNTGCRLWIHEYSVRSNGVKFSDPLFTVNK